MASSSQVGESVDDIEKRITKVLEDLKELGEGAFLLNAGIDSSQIMNSSFRESITAIRRTFEGLVEAGRPNIANEQLEYFEAYTCAAATLTLTNVFTWYTQALQDKVDKKDHNERFKKIRKIHETVSGKVKDVEEELHELEELLNKLNKEESNTDMDIQFTLKCELIVIDLENCVLHLIEAKRQLMVEFDSIKEHMKQSYARAGARIGAIASISFPLFKIIGSFANYGIVCAAVIGLGYTAWKLWTDVDFGTIVKTEYKSLDAEQTGLVRDVDRVSKHLDAFRNAYKVKDLRQKIKIMEAQHKNEMMEKDNKIKVLEAQNAEIKKARKPNP